MEKHCCHHHYQHVVVTTTGGIDMVVLSMWHHPCHRHCMRCVVSRERERMGGGKAHCRRLVVAR